jgi:hypothetical protein
MKLKVYYGGHSISDKGILKLKLKTDYTQQEEAGALYATFLAAPYSLIVDGVNYGEFSLDSMKIDSKFDTTLTLKGFYDNKLFTLLYENLKSTSDEEMAIIQIECVRGDNSVSG